MLAYADRKSCKDLAEILSYAYKTQLVLAEEEAGIYRNIHYMEGKVKEGSTSKITAISDTCHKIECASKGFCVVSTFI